MNDQPTHAQVVDAVANSGAISDLATLDTSAFALPDFLDRRGDPKPAPEPVKPAKRAREPLAAPIAAAPAKKATAAKPAKKDTAALAPVAALKPLSATAAKLLTPREGDTSGKFIRRVIKSGHKILDKELAAVVLTHFKGRTTTAKDVAWNRWDMRKKGELAE